jgi:hypothetical protein
MSTSENDPTQKSDSEQPEEDSQLIKPGYGAVLQPLPGWFRERKPGEPVTPEERERLIESFIPMVNSLMNDYAKRFDREAMLEALPDWLYDRLAAGGQVSQDDIPRVRAYFAENRPDLLERIDPEDALGGWNYGIWWERNHGRPGPSLPPRPGRPAAANDAPNDRGADEPET